jgi:hypothetical protein
MDTYRLKTKNKMVHLLFEDTNGKLCSIFDFSLIHNVFSNWDLTLSDVRILELVNKEIEDVSNHRTKYEDCDFFREKETKDFLVNQSNNILLHLRRLKRFLEEGIDKKYKLVLE